MKNERHYSIAGGKTLLEVVVVGIMLTRRFDNSYR